MFTIYSCSAYGHGTEIQGHRSSTGRIVNGGAKVENIMSDPYEIPGPVIDAIVEEGKPAEKAFRELAGVSVAALAEGSMIPAARLEVIERGATPTDDELEAISEALAVPKDLLVNE